MKIIKTKNYEDMSRKAANMIAAQIILKPDSVLGLATGSTPIGIYQQLIERYQKGDLDFHEVITINLDEYRGLSAKDEQSYHYYMEQHLFQHINIERKNIYIPDGTEPDKARACRGYDKFIERSGGIDLQLLGLGNNGHIGFNEPGDIFEKNTHCVKLADRTIQANSRFFSGLDEVPKEAYTVGIKTIMQAKKIVVAVNGSSKAAIVKEAFFGPITPRVPASILQLHNDVTVIGDAEALSLVCD